MDNEIDKNLDILEGYLSSGKYFSGRILQDECVPHLRLKVVEVRGLGIVEIYNDSKIIRVVDNVDNLDSASNRHIEKVIKDDFGEYNKISVFSENGSDMVVIFPDLSDKMLQLSKEINHG